MMSKFISKFFPLPNFGFFAEKLYPFLTAQSLVRFFYLFLLYVTTGIFSKWDLSLAPEAKISSLWPVFWLRLFDFSQGYLFINLFFVITVLIGALFPYKRIARILVFLGLLEFISFYVSMFKLDVDWYPHIFVAFLLIFLPDGWEKPENFSKDGRRRFLFVFWSCQAYLLLTYFMSGLGKFYGAITQVLQGGLNTFSLQSGVLHIADRLLLTHSTSALGPLLIKYPFLSWPFMASYPFIFLSSIFVAFHPAYHKIFGLLLILFHLGSHFTVNIGFPAHIVLIGILFLNSPFQKTPFIPGLDKILRFLYRKKNK